jgi:hypothetical protein
MPRLIITMKGIIPQLVVSGLPSGVAQRGVAVNALQGLLPANGWGKIPAHQCFITASDPFVFSELKNALPIPDTSVVTVEGLPVAGLVLFNWRITVGNAASGQGFTRLTGLPSLIQMYPAMTLQSVVTSATMPDPSVAVCNIDMTAGTVEALQYDTGSTNAGWYAQWTVETDGDPVVNFESANGTANVTLRDGDSFDISNSTSDGSDKSEDYALNFVLAQGGVPPIGDTHAPPQAVLSSTEGIPGTYAYGTSTSCSVTTYP